MFTYYSHQHQPMYDLVGLVTRDADRVIRDGPDWLVTDRVSGLRWLVLYLHRVLP
jgi:hypothetical protein